MQLYIKIILRRNMKMASGQIRMTPDTIRESERKIENDKKW